MPKAKFDSIYKDLKYKIETLQYPNQSLLPSENTMVNIYGCSRNTIRRALSELVDQGYVQSLHGIGVRVIYQPGIEAQQAISNIESFKEIALRNNKNTTTQVLHFMEIIADEEIHQTTGFPKGIDLYYIQRLRWLEDQALILDINMFRKDIIKGLTKEIAETSIYHYIENVLNMQIVTSKRQITVERTTGIDEKYMELGDYNCMAVVTYKAYNANGVMFEYSQSRHRPDHFCFQNTTTRKKA